MSPRRPPGSAYEISLRRGLPSPSAAWDDGAALAGALLAEPNVRRVELTINANRRKVVSWQSRRGVLVLSVHWALLEHLDDLVRLVTRDDRTAWSRLRRHLPLEAPQVPDHAPDGRVHDLDGLLSVERARLPHGPEEVRVTWGRWSARPPRRSLRLGSCEAGTPPLIRIHPVLDHRSVPGWFVGFVLYHELLHVVFPPIERGRRRVVHPASFRAAERRHPHHGRALRWERENIDRLLLRARQQARARARGRSY